MASNPSDNEATILRPNPSGRRSNAGQKPSQSAAQAEDLDADNTPSLSLGNAFIQRAVPVLNLAVALKTLPVDTDFSRLKSDFLEEITAYKNGSLVNILAILLNRQQFTKFFVTDNF